MTKVAVSVLLLSFKQWPPQVTTDTFRPLSQNVSVCKSLSFIIGTMMSQCPVTLFKGNT